MKADVVVVGSGASAVHAAWPLVKAGRRVLMLDVGQGDRRYAETIAPRSFRELRTEDPEQHRYFLGEDFEGIPEGPVRVGAQLTPPRQHLTRDAEKLLPIHAPEFQAMQSLALGGLAAGWGAAVPPFTGDDLRGWPINRAQLQPHYDAITRRIGICGTEEDDLAPFFGPSPHLLPPARIDSNGTAVLQEYAKQRQRLNGLGFFAGQARLAMVTRRYRGRGPARYHDMEFWSDGDRAVYRPRYTVEELQRYSNFTYRGGFVVRTFAEQGGGTVSVQGIDLATQSAETLRARALILGAGTLGTARIVLESLGAFDRPVPLVSNPYTYYPCLMWKRLGQRTRDRRHSLTQMMAYYDGARAHPVLQGQLYSYRSLLTFKLVKESPLAVKESIRLMHLLQNYFVVIGVHHEDRPWGSKRAMLRRGSDTALLEVDYRPTRGELEDRRERERGMMRCFRALGCLPLRRILPGEGASIHYAGVFPMTTADLPLTTTPDGQLRGSRRVYIADGASFPHLPAKGLTYTLMANANRIGQLVADGWEHLA